jgi:hypothetical protein
MNCNDPIFQAFLKEMYRPYWNAGKHDAANCVRGICGVTSRKELNTNHKARVIWKQLDDSFSAWRALERVGA